MRLVVVESPAKCKKIAGFLGHGYQVLATFGHIRALEEDLDAIGLNKDFDLRFRFLKEKARATKPLLDAAAGAEEIILAADDDREGEAIAYSVACLLKRDPLSFPRAVFHEITETAVRNAVANPRRLDMNRVYAQQARAVLDMMVGFTVSPVLWKHVARGLSAGRCQTPALRLLYDRETSIKGHTLQTSWGLQGAFLSGKTPFKATMMDELDDQESAMNYLENVHQDTSAIVTNVVQKPWSLAPPKPLMTSTLQQEASALYHLTPKTTMRIAQTLYEAGHITYMRTDDTTMSEEAVQAARAKVVADFGAEYLGPEVKVVKAKGAVAAQEAHECIRPTHLELRELPQTETWTAQDRKIYTLISQRALQSVMAAAKGQTRIVTLTLTADEEPFPWSATWRKTDFAGWKRLGETAKLDDEEDDEDTATATWSFATRLLKGAPLTWTSLQAVPKRSKASPRFTEATLIRELEHKGIGRPSTFASLVETIIEKGYAEKKDIEGQKIKNTTMNLQPRTWPPSYTSTEVALGAEKQKLVPTELGTSVLTFCLANFGHLFAYDFTAAMEQRLDRVASGSEPWKEVCRATWKSYEADYTRLMDKASAPSASDKMRDFGNGLKAVKSAKGYFLVLEDATKDKTKTQFATITADLFKSLTPEEAKATFDASLLAKAGDVMATIDGTPVLRKSGKFGPYVTWGTINLPLAPTDTAETIGEKLRAKAESEASKVKIGAYTFAKGPYGTYMYKTDLKTKEFITVPQGIDPKKLTEAEATAVYLSGKAAKATRGGRGGRGGRGRGH
jgi:DNA topoisomerase-1